MKLAASLSKIRLKNKKARIGGICANDFSRTLWYAPSVSANKIVLVTGGAGGLGRALASAFAAAGHRVVISGRSEERLLAVAQQLGAAGDRILAWPCDVSDRKQVEGLEAAIRARWGTVQILINNAGVARAMSFVELPDGLWQETLQTNLTGTFNCSKVFLSGMLASGWGRIINIASTAAKVGYSHATAYVASKHGVLGLTRSLALELARRNITVNAICPGYLNTELTRENARRMAEKTGKPLDQVMAMFAGSAPQNRLIEPEEVAALALFLAGENSAGITGQAINVDGGAVMV
jgi:NAD(P)-dependent dehydrogenase (short-subunit alcohol dehydrogenase family)